MGWHLCKVISLFYSPVYVPQLEYGDNLGENPDGTEYLPVRGSLVAILGDDTFSYSPVDDPHMRSRDISM